MKTFRGLALGFAAVALTGALSTASLALESPGQSPTVGEFLGYYAKALNMELPASADPVTVREALRATGVKVDTALDLSKPLTQADVVRIGKANGLNITTRNPLKSFTSMETEQFFVTYGVLLGRTSDVALRADHGSGDTSRFAQAKKKKKGKGKGNQSPNEPDDHDDTTDDHDDTAD